jgi:hypothetical protein
MSKLQNELNSTEVSKVDLDALTDLVESQLGNVGWHAKDAQRVE